MDTQLLTIRPTSGYPVKRSVLVELWVPPQPAGVRNYFKEQLRQPGGLVRAFLVINQPPDIDPAEAAWAMLTLKNDQGEKVLDNVPLQRFYLPAYPPLRPPFTLVPFTVDLQNSFIRFMQPIFKARRIRLLLQFNDLEQ